MSDDGQKRLNWAITTAVEAGKILMRYWRTPIDIQYKVDEFDPVTRADQETDAFIRAQIFKEFPSDLILSEENELTPERYDERVWMIDPLDDTKAFTNGLDAFSISIGCVQNGTPEIGVVYAPARGILYYALKGGGAFMKKGEETRQIFGSTTPTLSQSRIIVGLSSKARRPLDGLVAQTPFAQFIADGSIALAIARIAAGDAECTICTNPRVSKWDSAGGQAILEEVGGIVTDTRGAPLDYKQAGRGWSNLVVASANPNVHAEFITKVVGGVSQNKSRQS